jgi:hypothetical protein
VTTSDDVPDDGAKVPSPEYVAVTASAPVGVSPALQEPVALFPEAGVSAGVVHSVVAPTLKLTVPVGVPPEEKGATLAVKVTVVPNVMEVGFTDAVVTDPDATVRASVRDPDSPLASVTPNVMVCELVAAAVPVMAPVAAFKESALGSLPERIDHV